MFYTIFFQHPKTLFIHIQFFWIMKTYQEYNLYFAIFNFTFDLFNISDWLLS